MTRNSVIALALVGAAGLAPAISFASDHGVRAVATIQPLHALATAVMEGAGTPHLLIRGAASPHTFAFRPSDAEALEQADLVFWIGPALETALVNPLENLAGDTTLVTMADVPGLTLLPYRVGGPFAAHDHDHNGHDEHDHDEHVHDEHVHDDHGHDDHAHDDHGHDEHGHDEHGHDDHSHDDHAHDDHGHDDHDHGEHSGEADDHAHLYSTVDMHLWLDPQNAVAMVDAMAEALASADPDNAALYAANAEVVTEQLDLLTAEIAESLAPVRDRSFIVFHDAYQYFENRFDLTVAGSVTVSPERQPGAQRMAEIRETIVDSGALCVFAEPQFEPRLVTLLVEGTNVGTGVLDPLGADLDPGPALYTELMRRNAQALIDCLTPDQ